MFEGLYSEFEATFYRGNSPYENCLQCVLWIIQRATGLLFLERDVAFEFFNCYF